MDKLKSNILETLAGPRFIYANNRLHLLERVGPNISNTRIGFKKPKRVFIWYSIQDKNLVFVCACHLETRLDLLH